MGCEGCDTNGIPNGQARIRISDWASKGVGVAGVQVKAMPLLRPEGRGLENNYVSL